MVKKAGNSIVVCARCDLRFAAERGTAKFFSSPCRQGDYRPRVAGFCELRLKLRVQSQLT